MNRLYYLTTHWLFALLLTLFFIPDVHGTKKSESALIITSFQIEMNSYRSNINELYHELNREHPDMQYYVENMNCRSLSEINEWRGRMSGFLHKYEEEKPSFVILVGQEAWATYLSINNEFTRSVPCFAMLVSDRTLRLSGEPVKISSWEPELRTYTTQMPECNLQGAIVYHYNISKNIELGTQLFPKTRQINFFTDNTFGGLAMYSIIKDWVSREGDKYPYRYHFIDGRTCTFQEAVEQYSQMNAQENLSIFSTWRIDKAENYFIINTTERLLRSNKLPGITVSSIGLSNTAIGGYIPQYRLQGQEIGQMINRFLREHKTQGIRFINNEYVFDYRSLKQWDIERRQLPSNAILINQPSSLYRQNPVLFITAIASVMILFLCIAFSITYYIISQRNRRKLEQYALQLSIAKEQAEASNKLKTQFMANMSHEIRTPLNAIVGFSDVIAESHKELSEEEMKEFTGLISQNSQQLLKLINDILDLSRIEAKSAKYEPERTEMVSLCRSLLCTLEYARTDKKEVELRFESNIQELWGDIDPRYIQQVIINLLNNAAKFTEQGSITLSLERNGYELKFMVTDTGIGIPLDKQQAVFERFTKLDEFKQGTGLGLSICQAVVTDILKGRIWIDPDYTGGARFIVVIPFEEK